jgi:glc operon protein GlcG
MRHKPCLTAEDVRHIAAACRSEATALQLAVTVAITDDAGHLLHLQRLEAKTHTVDVAIGKARAAALMRNSTAWLEQRVKENPAMAALGFMAIQGGLPLMVGSDCVGAIGVSGAKSDQDEQIASAGCAALPKD